jgi:hypothetical protein
VHLQPELVGDAQHSLARLLAERLALRDVADAARMISLAVIEGRRALGRPIDVLIEQREPADDQYIDQYIELACLGHRSCH